MPVLDLAPGRVLIPCRRAASAIALPADCWGRTQAHGNLGQTSDCAAGVLPAAPRTSSVPANPDRTAAPPDHPRAWPARRRFWRCPGIVRLRIASATAPHRKTLRPHAPGSLSLTVTDCKIRQRAVNRGKPRGLGVDCHSEPDQTDGASVLAEPRRTTVGALSVSGPASRRGTILPVSALPPCPVKPIPQAPRALAGRNCINPLGRSPRRPTPFFCPCGTRQHSLQKIATSTGTK